MVLSYRGKKKVIQVTCKQPQLVHQRNKPKLEYIIVKTQFVTTQNEIGFARKNAQTISFGRAWV